MRERPILFSAPMVRAILAGTKTQTRRVVKPQPEHPHFASRHMLAVDDEGVDLYLHSATLARAIRSPYGQPGDRLWVREAWAPDPPIDDSWASTEWSGCGRRIDGVPQRFQHPAFCLYRAGWLHGDIRWRPGIHMPRWASRITLEVTAVRVERLQDISDSDAFAEGIQQCSNEGLASDGTARGTYRALWEAINGTGSWDANPWVWVVEFRRIAGGSDA